MEWNNSVSIARKEVREENQVFSNAAILSGWRLFRVELKIRMAIFRILLVHLKNPFSVFQVARRLDEERRRYLGDHKVKKLVKAGNTYAWDLYTPAFGSDAFPGYILGEIGRQAPVRKPAQRLVNAVVAITKKCPLQCEHCFEWNQLNQHERLSPQDWVKIIEKLQHIGVAQIQISGGEPLMRLDRIEEILSHARRGTEFWIYTSGFRCTPGKAVGLQQKGLTGMVISLDHYEEDAHNRFRGHDQAFQYAREAVRSCLQAGLKVALSFCITRPLATRPHLVQYMELANEWGVHHVQFLEPKAVGHYSGKDVALTAEQVQIIEEVYWDYNFSSAFRSYPLITYHGFYQRRSGCFAGGDRTIYIDTDGQINACPYCAHSFGSALDEHLEQNLELMAAGGCAIFAKANRN